MEWESTIGVEIHAQLKTKSKLFCSCSTDFTHEPNRHTCPICLGFPGVLPVLNKKAVELVIKTALALNCSISKETIFARKNYYYPDLPKAYQISQYEVPIGYEGFLEFKVENTLKKVRIKRVHLEEDTGKLIHEGGNWSRIDYNRCGVPLMEIVSEPDMADAEEVNQYIIHLRQILIYLGVCDGNMELGSLRCEPNVSVRLKGEEKLGVKTELKNLNSLHALVKAISFEIERQIKVLKEGGKIVQETRRWNDERQITESMRGKEYAQDYRYFPEPDLPPIIISDEWRENIRKTICELPIDKFKRLKREYGLNDYDANLLVSEKELGDYFEEVVKNFGCEAKKVCNWILGDFIANLKENKIENIYNSKVNPKMLADLLNLIEDDTISTKIAKEVFKEMFNTGKEPSQIVKDKGLIQISDDSIIYEAINKVINENPEAVNDYKKGKERAIGFLIGQVMKETKGKANPQKVNEILIKKLKSLE